MFSFEGIWLFIFPEDFRDAAEAFSVLLSSTISESMNAPSCVDTESELCRDDSAAFVLKFIAMASILLAGAAGIAIPLISRRRSFVKTDSSLFVAAKAFAAGVILSTGFVHMLSAGSKALSSSCLGPFPWSKFPFSGFFAMLAALATLLVDFIAAQYYERVQGLNRSYEEKGQVRRLEAGFESQIVPAGEEIDDRHVLVSQVVELGILSHSALIGLTLGVSHSPCTIKPLIAALSFHQFFEGFGLGRCISKLQFDAKSATIMACLFAAMAPIGIGTGFLVSSFFNPLSSGALVAGGTFDSLSAGVLVYMALVDLIAADFLGKRRRYKFRVQVVCYFMFFFGAGLMSLPAIWA